MRTAQTLYSYVQQIETEYDKIDNLTFSMVGDNTIQSNLTILKEESHEDLYVIKRNLKTQLSSYLGMLDCCDMLCVCLPTRELLGEMVLKEEFLKECMQVAAEGAGKAVVMYKGGDIWILREIRKIENMSFENMGTIIIRWDTEIKPAGGG